jgi:ankyrin repeat protein
VRILLARDEVEVNAKDKHGATPLSLAARNGRDGAVRLLLARGDIDVNIKDGWGATPLSLGAKRGRRAVVRLPLCKYLKPVNSPERITGS